MMAADFPVRRLMQLVAGLAVLWVAMASPLAALDHRLLTAHMVQHLLIMTVAAPLLLLAAPRRMLAGVSVHPALCWLAGTGTVLAWHVPALFQAAMRSGVWHMAEQASFLAAGLLFWRPVIDSEHGPARQSPWLAPVYLFLATLPCDALSAFLAFSNRVVYMHYRMAGPMPAGMGGLPAADDQQLAGALMWVWVTFAYLVPATAITIRALSPNVSAGQLRRC